ncbi:MAG: ABC transporter permease [Clostridiales bacterium]|jgi:putative ABC transport system permease protein|nr:ABC transporter permease [Clostridiales bacterium]
MSIDIIGTLSIGLLWGVMAVGVYITFRILDFADLTAEGCFTLGAAVAARLITVGASPIASTLAAFAAGAAAGALTGFFHTKLRIPPLLSGILTMTGLYSINIRSMGMKPNIPLMYDNRTIMSDFAKMFSISNKIAVFCVALICVSIVIFILWWFFNTEIGYAMRATGNNENMIRALGVNTNVTKMLGLMLGNSLVAFSGALIAQFNSYSDIGMGIGTIVIGLAAVIMGEVIFSDKNSYKGLIAVVLGSISYRFIIALVLELSRLPTTDTRGISSIVLAIALALPLIRKSLIRKKPPASLEREVA